MDKLLLKWQARFVDLEKQIAELTTENERLTAENQDAMEVNIKLSKDAALGALVRELPSLEDGKHYTALFFDKLRWLWTAVKFDHFVNSSILAHGADPELVLTEALKKQ
jgi:hypothetical protein